MHPLLVFAKVFFQGIDLHHVSFLCHCASRISSPVMSRQTITF
jgi:hypothetical protein